MKTIETLFSYKGKTDSKHILNTSTKVVNSDILNDIETNGVTIEQLNDFSSKGIDVFKYQTQITIHGLFPALLVNYLNGYKVLFQNKNKSIGVKWNAIDMQKKKHIYSMATLTGWGIRHNSTEYLIFKQKRFFHKQEAINQAMEFNKDIARIDSSIYYGGAGVYLSTYMGAYYAICEVTINGILQQNCDLLIEQITGKTIQELQGIQEIKDAERKERDKQRDIEQTERKVREAEQKAKNAILCSEFRAKNPLNGFKELTDITPKQGMVRAKITGGQYEFESYKRIGANLCVFPSDINGNKLNKARQFYGSKISGYIKL